MAIKSRFNWWIVPARVNLAFLIVFITYNPTGYSYVHWLTSDNGGPLPLKLAAGISLFILLYVFVGVTWSVFRISGIVAGSITAGLISFFVLLIALPGESFQSFAGTVVWVSYFLLMTLSIVIGVGLSWSHLMFRLSGQEYKRSTRVRVVQ